MRSKFQHKKIAIWCSKTFRFFCVGLLALAIFFSGAVPAHAQTAITSAVPEPGTSLPAPPTEVRLTFDHPLLDQGTSLSVNDEARQQVDNQDSQVDPNNQFALVVTLPELPEGQYTVTYVAGSVGSSTILTGSYQFTIDFPDPVIKLTTPQGGEVFNPGPIPVEIQTQYIDFSADDSRIRIYVDGALYMEMRELTGRITDLPTGVHEIRLVLAQSGQEVPETSSTQYVVIADPDPELAGREAAAVAAPDPGLQLTPLQLVGVIAATLVLMSIGLWLGKSAKKAK